MSKIKWSNNKQVSVGKHNIFCADHLEDGYKQGSGIKLNSKRELILKNIFWPLFSIWRDLLIDGFIDWELGGLIRKYIRRNTIFLEIGCGNMSLKRFIPENIYYNALDIELSEFHLRRILGKKGTNIMLASATNIPAKSNSASLIVSAETFEHIPEIDKAMQEIHRIAVPGAILICSIPNNFGYRYQKKGPHHRHINNWSFDSYIQFMTSHNFEFVEGFMKGLWIPLPTWLTKTSYKLPISSKSEFYNTNFFYVFKVKK